MPILTRILLIAGLAAAVPVAVRVYDAARDQPPAPPPPTTAPTATLPWHPVAHVGNAGCAAVACHGGASTASLTPDCWQSAATRWFATDPHTRAYDSLKSPLAARIMATLKEPTPATESLRCLACHTDPVQRSSGIGCETCHGAAGRWLHAHTTFGDRPRAAAYDSLGMTKLFDLGVRAEVCAGCHVGAPADPSRGLPLRDMNHDMIAAGHPRLNFDFADFQRRMRPHWFEKDRTAAFEAKAWLVGRVASAEAAASLLADRAARSDPWPELAEMNCFACHHEFEPASWRLSATRRSPTRKLGMAPWQTIWPVTRPDDFAKLGSDASRDLAELVSMMERSRHPNANVVAERAKTTAAKLQLLRYTLAQKPAKEVAGLALDVFAAIPPERADSLDWDEAAQVYYGLAAIDRARVLVDRAPPDPSLEKFAEHLRFPRPTGGIWFDSPRGYAPQAGRTTLRECLQSVPKKADVIVR